MASFTVNSVINSNTITVIPNWLWEGGNGNKVIILGYTKPSNTNGEEFLKQRLTALLLNKQIELKNPTGAENGVISCYVYLNGIEISQYFPELKVKV